MNTNTNNSVTLNLTVDTARLMRDALCAQYDNAYATNQGGAHLKEMYDAICALGLFINRMA
jgi:hypothetical protein